MLPSAFQSLSDPCLPDFWIDTYTAAPGAIAMTAGIIIFLVEYGSTRYLAQVDRKIAAKKAASDASPPAPSIATDVEAGKREEPRRITENAAHFGHHHIDPAPIEGETDASTAATQKLGVAILEAGIIFHSVFIGLTLAVSTGSDFISLFITIIFHRISPTSNPPSS
jgi:zinc transporter 1/2/3